MKFFCALQAINVAVDALPTVSVLLATGPDMVAADVVKAVEERLRVSFWSGGRVKWMVA